jgi:hypothetical protein
MWLKGTLDYNLSLSNRRAKAVVSRLSSQSGISIDRLMPRASVNWPRWRPTIQKRTGPRRGAVTSSVPNYPGDLYQWSSVYLRGHSSAARGGLSFAALSWQRQTTYRVSEAGRAGSEFQQLRRVKFDRKNEPSLSYGANKLQHALCRKVV